MKRRYHSDQNELMIVNPGLLGDEESLSLDQLFLGDDGNVYQIQGLDEEEIPQGLNELYLGEDGTLYGPERSGLLGKYETEKHGSYSHYFLGEDRTLYEVF